MTITQVKPPNTGDDAQPDQGRTGLVPGKRSSVDDDLGTPGDSGA